MNGKNIRLDPELGEFIHPTDPRIVWPRRDSGNGDRWRIPLIYVGWHCWWWIAGDRVRYVIASGKGPRWEEIQ